MTYCDEWLATAKQARDRAEEARTIASWMKDEGAKSKMLKVAQSFDDLARRSERTADQLDQLMRLGA
jgi:hypothetical protein